MQWIKIVQNTLRKCVMEKANRGEIDRARENDSLSNKSVKQILVGLIFQTYFIIMAGQEMYFTEEGWP